MRNLTALVALVAVALALPALAPGKNSPGVTRSGACTGGGATWKLKAKHDDGLVEAEFEVDQNRNGVTWRVVLRRNGNVAARTRATTRPPSGSFEVRRLLGNSRGGARCLPGRPAPRARSARRGRRSDSSARAGPACRIAPVSEKALETGPSRRVSPPAAQPGTRYLR